MARTYTLTMSLSGFRTGTNDTDRVKESTLQYYTISTDLLRFGATANFAQGNAVRAEWPNTTDGNYIKNLDPSIITSITMNLVYTDVGRDISTRYGLLREASGNARITSETTSAITIEGNTTAASIDLTSIGLNSYGYGFGGTVSSANTGTITSITVVVVTTETEYNYTLAYDANGGTGAPSSQTGTNIRVSPLYTFTISQIIPIKAGFEFLKWNTSSTGSGNNYDPGDSITVTSDGTTTLYATWKALNLLNIVNNGALDLYLVNIIENSALIPYRVAIVNNSQLNDYV